MDEEKQPRCVACREEIRPEDTPAGVTAQESKLRGLCCRACAAKYPKSLIRCAGRQDGRAFAMGLRSGPTLCFKRAQIHGEFCYLQGVRFVARAPMRDRELRFGSYGIDIRIADIAWCAQLDALGEVEKEHGTDI